MIPFILASIINTDADQNFLPPKEPATHMCLQVEEQAFAAAINGHITRTQAFDLTRNCWKKWT